MTTAPKISQPTRWRKITLVMIQGVFRTVARQVLDYRGGAAANGDGLKFARFCR
jgi:hypothetical protein